MTTHQGTHTNSPMYWLGMAGGILGVVAGILQALIGSSIPQWSGDKDDPLPLGLLTVVLSLAAITLIQWHTRGRTPDPYRRLIVGVAIIAIAGFASPPSDHCGSYRDRYSSSAPSAQGLVQPAGNDPDHQPSPLAVAEE